MKKARIIRIVAVSVALLAFTGCNEQLEPDPIPVVVERIDEYEGMEITDWLDEQTLVLAKENSEFGKMSLLENSQHYPRSLYLYNVNTEETKTVKAQKNMFLGGATFSPDKEHLLYYEYSIGDTAHYMMSIKESEESPVTEDILRTALTAQWTYDQNVIGVSYAGGAYLADTNKNITKIAELEGQQLFLVKKAKDRIFYVTIGDSLEAHMLDLVTKGKKDLEMDNVYGIFPSHDGNQILIYQGEESTRKLLIADAEGNILQTLAEGTEITGVSWSPDQLMIAYQLRTTHKGVENSGLYLYDVLADKSIKIAENIENATTSWSPTSKAIAVAELDGKTYSSKLIYLK